MINGLLFYTFLFDKLFIPLWALSWHSSAVLLAKQKATREHASNLYTTCPRE